MTSDVIRRLYMSYNPLFHNCLHSHNFAKSEPIDGLEHLPTDSSTPLTSRSNPPEVDSLFKRTEQVVFPSDKNYFVWRKQRPPGKGGNICSKVAISEEKKYKSQYQTDGEDECDKNGQETEGAEKIIIFQILSGWNLRNEFTESKNRDLSNSFIHSVTFRIPPKTLFAQIWHAAGIYKIVQQEDGSRQSGR